MGGLGLGGTAAPHGSVSIALHYQLLQGSHADIQLGRGPAKKPQFAAIACLGRTQSRYT